MLITKLVRSADGRKPRALPSWWNLVWILALICSRAEAQTPSHVDLTQLPMTFERNDGQGRRRRSVPGPWTGL
jgi:hypothetical protein